MRATYRPDGHYLWDFWLYRETDAYHLFYLQAPLAFTPRERHRRSSIGHAVSHDLQSWREVEGALQAGAAETDWDSVSLWTGCVVKHEQQYYLFYTARCRLDVAADGYVGHTQRIGVATSKNLYEWKKHPDNPVVAADYRYYESREQAYNAHEGWRDPYVVKDKASGWFYMFFTARDGRRPDPKARGCIGRARSRDLLRWEVLPPAASPGLFTDMEVPSLHWHDGRWYMLFAVKAEWYSDAYRQAIAPEEPQTGVFYLTADALDAEFTMPERHPVLSGTSRAQYTGRIIEAPDGRAVFLSWNGGTDEKMAQTPDSYTLGAAVRIRYDGGLLRLDETVETSGGESWAIGNNG